MKALMVCKVWNGMYGDLFMPGYTHGVGRTLNRKSISHAGNIFNVTRNSNALLLYSAMNKWKIYSSGSNVQTEAINSRK
jgi:hypothetical protein